MIHYLKPCPICSGKATLTEAYVDRSGYYCECISCAKSTDEFSTRQAAVAAWDRSNAEEAGVEWLRNYLHGRARTIYGGSSEVQRNIIASTILGL